MTNEELVAADVCQALDIKNSSDAMTRLDDDEKGVALTDTPSGKQEMNTVNEPGLYSLVLGSRKPEAKAFKRWITHDVIPSIRRTGGYISGQEEMSAEELMARALTVAQKVLADREARLSALTRPWRTVRTPPLPTSSLTRQQQRRWTIWRSE